MPHRDPETGQFLSHDQTGYDDIEVASFGANAGIEAANLGGGTGFGGGNNVQFEAAQIIDYDDIVDRNEALHLLEARHRLVVFVNSTETADGTVTGAVEISASPSLSEPTQDAGRVEAIAELDGDVLGDTGDEDTIDLVGRSLVATAHAPYTDGASGVGGAGSAGVDRYEGDTFPAEMGRFHPRDELFVNGRFTVWNIDDAAVHLAVSGQHVYGVISDD